MTPKKRFILDENVLISAQTGIVGESRDSSCALLVNRIISICHTIVIDNALYASYKRKLNLERNRPSSIGARMLPVLASATRISGKYDGFGKASAPPFDGEETIPQGSQDDVSVSIRLAVETGATIVTTDGPLREHLAASDLEVLRGLKVVTPQEALGLL